MTFEEWWMENYSGEVNGWWADNIRVGWKAALKYGSEKTPSNKQKFQLNQIKEKFAEFANNQETIPQSYMDVLTRNFWDLL